MNDFEMIQECLGAEKTGCTMMVHPVFVCRNIARITAD